MVQAAAPLTTELVGSGCAVGVADAGLEDEDRLPSAVGTPDELLRSPLVGLVDLAKLAGDGLRCSHLLLADLEGGPDPDDGQSAELPVVPGLLWLRSVDLAGVAQYGLVQQKNLLLV